MPNSPILHYIFNSLPLTIFLYFREFFNHYTPKKAVVGVNFEFATITSTKEININSFGSKNIRKCQNNYYYFFFFSFAKPLINTFTINYSYNNFIDKVFILIQCVVAYSPSRLNSILKSLIVFGLKSIWITRLSVTQSFFALR